MNIARNLSLILRSGLSSQGFQQSIAGRFDVNGYSPVTENRRGFATQTIKVEVPDELSNAQEQTTRRKGSKVPRPQEDAPFFSGQAVICKNFREISLSDYKGKWLVLFFYPLDFTFVCPTEIIAFSDAADKFKGIGCEIIACSTDSHFSHLGWINTPRKKGGLGDMNIPLLSDYSKSIARDYGVLLESLGAALRGLFIIDPEGKIRHTSVNDLPVGRSVEETLRLVGAFQFFDKHGEVCPANWTPGAATIKPSDAGEYFEKAN
jgi:peroxiredoxin (alkyl hydroperoxide reductase subunit C)